MVWQLMFVACVHASLSPPLVGLPRDKQDTRTGFRTRFLCCQNEESLRTLSLSVSAGVLCRGKDAAQPRVVVRRRCVQKPPTAPRLSVFCCGVRLGYRVDMVEGGLTLLDMQLRALCERKP